MPDILSNSYLVLGLTDGTMGPPGPASYVDIRYSQDGVSFTEENGTVPGKWIGFYSTTDQAVLEPDYVPVWENYKWSQYAGQPGMNYSLKSDYNQIYKFLNSAQEPYSYTYSPSSLEVSFYLQQGDLFPQLVENGKITISCTYTNQQGTVVTQQLAQGQGTCSVNLNQNSVIENKNIELIRISGQLNGVIIQESLLNVVYGMSQDMAKFSLNAADITASILSTKLIFNSDGLTIRNGGISIENNSNEKVFFADQQGNLFFKGSLSVGDGMIGGWEIDQWGLTSQNGIVGLYSGGQNYYPGSNIPIRFWAGKDGQNYAFAVDQTGKLYANNAEIRGIIRATSGSIEDIFTIGIGQNIITINGKDQIPYIGTGNYVSGALGNGWRISADGSAEFDNATIRGKIQSAVFEYNRISSIGGSLYIAPSIYIEIQSQPIAKDEENNYLIKWTIQNIDLTNFNGRQWLVGDWVRLQGNLTNGTSNIYLNNTLAQISLIENNNTIQLKFEDAAELQGYKMLPGSSIVYYGSGDSRNGLYLTAVDKNSPYLDIYNNTDLDQTPIPAVRLGNLQGIGDTDFPSQMRGYGLYSSNAFLRGQLMLPGAGITNQNSIQVNGSPVRIWAGKQTTEDITEANFIVTADGSLYARQGIFEGTVKATQSQFSGTIKAAGIVLDPDDQNDSPLISKDHFFVGYSSDPQSFNDYILNIDSSGLSIWEGGFRAYSDYASGQNPQSSINPIYGYSEGIMPSPYIYLIDSGTETDLQARLVANKIHGFFIQKVGEKYNYSSTIINKGLWFDNIQSSSLDYRNVESSLFTQTYRHGIFKNQKGIVLTSQNFVTIESSVRINPETEDYDITAGLLVRGQLSLRGKQTLDNQIELNGNLIQQAKDQNNVSIGLNFIATT